MAQMIRKQIYIQKNQEDRLKKVAEARGVSEAEIIRRALDVELKWTGYRPAYDGEAFARFLAFMEELDERPAIASRKRDWTREDLYEERMKRHD